MEPAFSPAGILTPGLGLQPIPFWLTDLGPLPSLSQPLFSHLLSGVQSPCPQGLQSGFHVTVHGKSLA